MDGSAVVIWELSRGSTETQALPILNQSQLSIMMFHQVFTASNK